MIKKEQRLWNSPICVCLNAQTSSDDECYTKTASNNIPETLSFHKPFPWSLIHEDKQPLKHSYTTKQQWENI